MDQDHHTDHLISNSCLGRISQAFLSDLRDLDLFVFCSHFDKLVHSLEQRELLFVEHLFVFSCRVEELNIASYTTNLQNQDFNSTKFQYTDSYANSYNFFPHIEHQLFKQN